MKKLFFITLMTAIPFMASSQTKVSLTVGENSMTATLVENEATRELKDLLGKGPITILMSDYGGFEKVGALPLSLPTSDARITTDPGDIMLYQGNNIVIFYGRNSWSYTRLGKIDGATADNLKAFLGNGNVSLTLSLEPSSDIGDIVADRNTDEVMFDMNGSRIIEKSLKPGIYIINGKKTLIKTGRVNN